MATYSNHFIDVSGRNVWRNSIDFLPIFYIVSSFSSPPTHDTSAILIVYLFINSRIIILGFFFLFLCVFLNLALNATITLHSIILDECLF